MNLIKSKQVLKFLINHKYQIKTEKELGLFIIDQAKEFSRKIGGQSRGINHSIIKCLSNPAKIRNINAAHQYLQTAMMPDYEKNLYEYYRGQEYLILLTFLSYPFKGLGCLRSYIKPYWEGANRLKKMRILDYGAGLPYGLIHLLRSKAECIESLTLADLELIHTKLVEFILNGFQNRIKIVYHKLNHPEQLPYLDKQIFNFMYGKDIFEHLKNPEGTLRYILEHADEQSICYFDFSDHGERHLQHISPKLNKLNDVMREFGFEKNRHLVGLSEFTRGIGKL